MAPSGLRDYSDPMAWYWLTICGQALSGIGAPFVACLTTKISHQWFKESERHFATAVIGMSTPIGTILGSGVTPLFVTVRLLHIKLAKFVLRCFTEKNIKLLSKLSAIDLKNFIPMV